MADPSETSASYDTTLRHIWRVGDTFQIHTEPTVEGMTAGTRWINEVFMVIFIVPSYTKKDGTKEKTSILLRTPSACSRTKLDNYDFPFPLDSNIRDMVIKAKGSHLSLQDVLATLNHKPVFLPSTPPSHPTETPVGNHISAPSSFPLLQPSHKDLTEISDRLSVQLALSQAREAPSQLPAHLQDEQVLDHLAHELSRRFTFTKPASTYSDDPPLQSQPPPPVPHLSRKIKSFRSIHSSSSSTSRRTGSFSTSSPSRSSASSKSHKVRYHRKRHSSGFFSCPFSVSDTRQLARPSKRIHAKSEERKYLRYALHDLYSEFNTLKNFVDSLRTELVSSPTKPYTSDLIWLQHHADYLDSLLLHTSAGPWTAWNEIITDKLTRAFLELMVRVSPKRQYPDLLEEPVRKWMKRKRIGIASAYGPTTSFLSQAKVTDTGIEPKNG